MVINLTHHPVRRFPLKYPFAVTFYLAPGNLLLNPAKTGIFNQLQIPVGASLEDALGDTLRSTVAQRTAGYNYVFVEDDKSHGIHNPFYCAQLLQQSIIFLNPGKIPNAAIVYDEHYAMVRNP